MADFPYTDGGKFATYGVSGATSLGTLLTAGSAHVKGAYVQLTASTDFPCSYIIINTNGPTDRVFLDIATGGAGSETVIIPNLAFRSTIGTVTIPLIIPAGVRLSARIQSATGSLTMRVSCTLVAGGFASPVSFNKLTAYGADTTATDGVVYQSNGTAINTKSPYQQFTASTTSPIKALLFVGIPYSANSYLIDIAIGGAGSETVLIPDISKAVAIGGSCFYQGWFPCSIPAGTRLSYREQCSTGGAGIYADFILYALC